MKTLKVLRPIMLLLCLIFFISTILLLTDIIPSIPEDILKKVSGISFAVYALCLLITKEEYRKLYETRNREYDSASITMDNLENTIKHRDREVNDLNDLIRDTQTNNTTYREALKVVEGNIANSKGLIEQIEQLGKPVAITMDNGLYYSFEVKKEGGIIVTRKDKNSKLNKNEKVPARLGIDIKGIVHIFERGEIKPFDPLNMIPS